MAKFFLTGELEGKTIALCRGRYRFAGGVLECRDVDAEKLARTLCRYYSARLEMSKSPVNVVKPAPTPRVVEVDPAPQEPAPEPKPKKKQTRRRTAKKLEPIEQPTETPTIEVESSVEELV